MPISVGHKQTVHTAKRERRKKELILLGGATAGAITGGLLGKYTSLGEKPIISEKKFSLDNVKKEIGKLTKKLNKTKGSYKTTLQNLITNLQSADVFEKVPKIKHVKTVAALGAAAVFAATSLLMLIFGKKNKPMELPAPQGSYYS